MVGGLAGVTTGFLDRRMKAWMGRMGRDADGCINGFGWVSAWMDAYAGGLFAGLLLEPRAAFERHDGAVPKGFPVAFQSLGESWGLGGLPDRRKALPGGFQLSRKRWMDNCSRGCQGELDGQTEHNNICMKNSQGAGMTLHRTWKVPECVAWIIQNIILKSSRSVTRKRSGATAMFWKSPGGAGSPNLSAWRLQETLDRQEHGSGGLR